jgi:hypothetical protein
VELGIGCICTVNGRAPFIWLVFAFLRWVGGGSAEER